MRALVSTDAQNPSRARARRPALSFRRRANAARRRARLRADSRGPVNSCSRTTAHYPDHCAAPATPGTRAQLTATPPSHSSNSTSAHASGKSFRGRGALAKRLLCCPAHAFRVARVGELRWPQTDVLCNTRAAARARAVWWSVCSRMPFHAAKPVRRPSGTCSAPRKRVRRPVPHLGTISVMLPGAASRRMAAGM